MYNLLNFFIHKALLLQNEKCFFKLFLISSFIYYPFVKKSISINQQITVTFVILTIFLTAYFVINRVFSNFHQNI